MVAKNTGAPLQHAQELDLAMVVLGVGLFEELVAQQRALAHELVPRRTEADEVDVVDEAAVVAQRSRDVPRRQDQRADAAAKHRAGAGRQGQEQLGAAALVGRIARSIDRVVEPERELDGIAVGQERRDFIGATQAVPDVVEVVEGPVRRTEESAELPVDLGR